MSRIRGGGIKKRRGDKKVTGCILRWSGNKLAKRHIEI